MCADKRQLVAFETDPAGIGPERRHLIKDYRTTFFATRFVPNVGSSLATNVRLREPQPISSQGGSLERH